MDALKSLEKAEKLASDEATNTRQFAVSECMCMKKYVKARTYKIRFTKCVNFSAYEWNTQKWIYTQNSMNLV